MKKQNKRKLKLKVQTIRQLDAQELKQTNGGGIDDSYRACY